MRLLTVFLSASLLWVASVFAADAATPEPSATAAATGTPTSSATAAPAASASATATGTPVVATPAPEASPSPAPANFTLSGRLVVDGNSTGVEDAGDAPPKVVYLVLVPWSTADQILAPTPVVPPVVELYAAPDGSFAFERLPADSYTLRVYWPFGFVTKGTIAEGPDILRAAFRVTEKGEIVAPDPLPKYWPGSLEPLVPDEPILGPIPDPILVKKIDNPNIVLVPVFTTGSAGSLPVGRVDVAAALRQQQTAAQLPTTGVRDDGGNAWSAYLPLALAALILLSLAALLVRRSRA